MGFQKWGVSSRQALGGFTTGKGMSGRDYKKLASLLQNFFLKAYNNETVRLAITGTKFESALPFTRSRNALVLSPEDDVRTFFKLAKKMPQFLLLGG